MGSSSKSIGGLNILTITAAICAMLTVVSFGFVRGLERDHTQIAFEKNMSVYHSLFADKMAFFYNEVDALSRLYNSSSVVSRGEFRAFAMPSVERGVGIEEIYWVPRVSARERMAHENATWSIGLGGNAIHSHNDAGSDISADTISHDVYYPITFVEPLAENFDDIGLNIGANPVRRANLDKVIAGGSAKIFTWADVGSSVDWHHNAMDRPDDHNDTAMIIQPLYKGLIETDGPRARTEKFTGFIILKFDMAESLENIHTNGAQHDVNITIVDAAGTQIPTPLYRHAAHVKSTPHDGAPIKIKPDDLLIYTAALDVPERLWAMEFSAASSSYTAGSHWLSWYTLALALLLSGTVIYYVYSTQRRNAIIQNEVQRRTADLRAAEARERATLDAISDGVIVIDDNSLIVDFNHAAETLFGYALNDVRGKNVSVLLPESEREQHEIYTKQSKLHEARIINLQRQLQGRRNNGTVFPMELTVAPMTVADSKGFVGIVRDITARQRTENALRISEERYTLIMEGVLDAVWDWDISNNTTYMSPRFLEILGFKSGEFALTAENWFERIHPNNREKYSTRLTDHLKGEAEVFSCEYQVRNKDGAYVWVLDRGKAVRDTTGWAIRMAGSVSDITIRRQAEDGLRRAQKLDAVGQLAGGIAHEFNNVLVGIGGFAEMAVMDIEDADTVTMCLGEVRKATERARILTRDMLAFSRNQEVNPTLLAFDVSVPLHDMATFLRPVLGEGVELEMAISEDEANVYADPNQLSQVIMNFAINARDAMPDGGHLTIGSKIVELTAKQASHYVGGHAGRYAQIFVSDNGTGIDEVTQKRLFEPFFTTKDPGKGTGLGLSVAYGIVTQAGGFIALDSTLGKGSTFMLNLPLIVDDTP